ncbi:MAG: amino acid racemase [Candidatus Micrarchaeota archaeon]
MIGVLGGMGPESTAYTYMRMVRYCQQELGSSFDCDFPPIVMFSMPILDVVEEGSNDAAVLSALGRGLGVLEKAGASFSFIACNTMQGFVPELRKKYEMMSLVEETLRAAQRTGVRNWGLLSTEVTARKGYYQEAFRSRGMSLVAPDNSAQAQVTRAIREILSGADIAKAGGRLRSVGRCLEAGGADGLVLACTDLPLALQGPDAGMIVLDTADIIARAAVKRYVLESGGPPFLF